MDTNIKSSALPGTEASEWQTCPVCHGLGKVWDFMLTNAYPLPEYTLSNGKISECPVCNGKRIIKI